jgi:hypothetical protein
MKIHDSDCENLPLCDDECTLTYKMEGYHKIRDSHIQRYAEQKSKLKDEIKRCEDLKCQDTKFFVEEIWEELKYWWDKCLV